MIDLVMVWVLYLMALMTVGGNLLHAVLARPGTRRVARILLFAPAIGLVFTAYHLISLFWSASGVDPAQKATLLAAGISESMNCTAFGILVLLVSVPPYLIGQWRLKRRLEAGGETLE